MVYIQSYIITLVLLGIFSVNATNIYGQKINGKTTSKSLGAISLTVNVTNVTSEVYNGSTQLIYNGAITISASGGNGPYTYSIKIGQGIYHVNYGYFPMLTPGSYAISVMDASS